MKLQFLGATQSVTGSRYLLTVGQSKVLVDCGLYQGYKNYREKNWSDFPVDPGEIEAVLLTHAHIDHSGYIPRLVKMGFRGSVFTTPATFDLCKVMLPDSGYLQEEEAEYANKKKFSKHSPALPLYTEKEAVESLNRFSAIDWGQAYKLKSGIEFKFTPAGHILGASSVHVKNQGPSVLFSGDIGRSHDPIMQPPQTPESADVVLVESTYGNRVHDPIDPIIELEAVINRTMKRNGVLVIPSFAVGRAQLLLYYVRQLIDQNRIPRVPVYLNSPMASKVNEIFVKHSGETKLTREEAESVCATAKIVHTQEDSIALNSRKGPMILIAASGMATGGRVLHHIKAFAGDERNTILFAGFQVGGTRGDQMVRGASEVKIHGEFWPIRAEVLNLHSLSAHADCNGVVGWLRNLKQPKQVFITHGELAASDALRIKIARELGWSSRVPEISETVQI